MNQISQKQNQEKYIRYLAAQRQLYDENKVWEGVLLLLPVVLAILGSAAFLAIGWAFVSPLLTWATWVYALGEVFVFPYFTSGRRSEAAKIQELFDCELLELPWNDALGEKPYPQNIYKAFQRFVKSEKSNTLDNLKNWYTTPPLDDQMPIALARLVCQRQNIWWDSEQRRAYARGIIAASILFFFFLITIGIVADWSFRQFLQGPLALSITVLIVGIKHALGHYKAAKRLDELHNRVDLLVQAAANKVNETILSQNSRDLQTEIFHHRSENPSVFTWYYNLIRDRQEDISRKSE
jgi:hypothetical protein